LERAGAGGRLRIEIDRKGDAETPQSIRFSAGRMCGKLAADFWERGEIREDLDGDRSSCGSTLVGGRTCVESTGADHE
jgi:hypothetical protein